MTQPIRVKFGDLAEFDYLSPIRGASEHRTVVVRWAEFSDHPAHGGVGPQACLHAMCVDRQEPRSFPFHLISNFKVIGYAQN